MFEVEVVEILLLRQSTLNRLPHLYILQKSRSRHCFNGHVSGVSLQEVMTRLLIAFGWSNNVCSHQHETLGKRSCHHCLLEPIALWGLISIQKYFQTNVASPCQAAR